MTRPISWSHRTFIDNGKRHHVLRLMLWGLWLGVGLSREQVNWIVAARGWSLMLAIGLPLERPNAFRRVREVDTWRRVGFLCFAVSLFVRRKDVTP